MILSTYTYAILKVSHAAYAEIKAKLEAAGYSNQFHNDRDGDGVVIDMHGIALSDEGEKTMDSENHPHTTTADLRSFPQSDIENWFQYHAPSPEQIIQYGEIRTAAKIFAETINRHVPASADKTAAMRELRGCVMAANLAIACNTPAAPTIGSTLPPHQQRVLAERAELEEKLGKLRTFFNGPTYAAMADTQSGRDEQDRLQEQADIMDKYRAILVERIDAF